MLRKLLLFAAFVAAHVSFASVTVEDVIQRLESIRCYHASVEWQSEIMLGNQQVDYKIEVWQQPAVGDSLAPCSYLCQWTADSPSGFSAYNDGNYYKFRNSRLMERHASENPEVFAPSGNTMRGVQNTELFVSVLPAYIARKMADLTRGGEPVVKNTGANISFRFEDPSGQDRYDYTFTFYGGTLLPAGIEMNMNYDGQGAITQIITYQASETSDVNCIDLSEQALMQRFPDAFGRFRSNSFTLDNLRGQMLPSFTAPTIDRRRYTYRSGDRPGQPMVVALLDSDVDATADVVGQIRRAMSSLPFTAGLILAFVDNDLEAISSIAGNPLPGEEVLMSARRLARDCGATDYPTLLFVDADGRVADVHVGRNNNLSDIVIQKTLITK